MLDKKSNESDDSVKEHAVSLKFVPVCAPAKQKDIETLQEFVRNSKRLLVMTG